MGLAALSVLAMTAIFPPIGISWLAFFALVPWIIVIKKTGGREQFIISFLAGLGFYLINDRWVLPITLPGYISMSIYLAFNWPVAGWLVQKFNRRWGVPIFLSLPMVWVSLEWIRSWMITGFPWFFLGHSQATTLPMIQIADLGGAYAISFVLAMVNGAIAELLISLKERKLRQALPAVVISLIVLVAAVGYGFWRLGEGTLRPGPTVAVVQDDFPMFVESEQAGPYDIFEGYLQQSFPLMKHQPDMIIWPETCIGCSINPEFLNGNPTDEWGQKEQPHGKVFAEAVSSLAKSAGSYLVVGAISKEYYPAGHNPTVDKFNSALIYDREGKYIDRYDKIRLVLFGEVVPFRFTWPALYRFLNENMTPYGKDGFEYSLTRGQEYKRFKITTSKGEYRYSVAICYEDTMADLIRKFAEPRDGKKPIDFLINISNDGWFNHSSELPQHFEICVFRAVENRLAIARSVNTGISGFISSNGQISGVVSSGNRIFGPGIRGAEMQELKIDSRITVYSRIGDWPLIVMTVLVVTAGSIPANRKKCNGT
jgi:apolipoprotein N-acyltransferase